MPSVTKQQIASLVKLQKVELEAGSIKTKLNNVEKSFEKFDNELVEFRQLIETQESVVNDLNQKYHDYETDVRLNLDSIKKSEAKLISVKTNKEYQASLKEIDSLKDKNSKLEDEMIEFLDRIEDAENSLNRKNEEYSALEAQIKTEKEVIQKEAEEGRLQLDRLDAEWKTVSSGIEADLLTIFQQVKSNQNNEIGIVAVIDAVCQGCHVNIPPQMYNELQRGDSLKRCPMCQRIIYWKEENKRPE
jgi:uncharacterized protein